VSSATLSLAAALISRRSITPDDAGCLDIISERLAPLGFRIERLRYGEVSNLWARYGDAPPLLVFAGHTDVVPAGPAEYWASDPFTPVVRDGFLYGRGAADMKGSLAAMVTAAERFLSGARKCRGSLGFLLTSDEEGQAVDGTQRVLDHLRGRRESITWCLVGEPSCEAQLGDTVRIGRRGSLNGRLTVRGAQGHVAYPERADNPIHRSLSVLDELCRTRWDEGNEYFPPTSFQISNIAAGTGAENVIPGTFEAWFNFRFSTASGETSLRARVEEAFARHGLDYSIDWFLSGAPFLTTNGRLLAATQHVIHSVTGLTPKLSTGGGTSDGRFIAPTGAEVVELGPNNNTIHKVNERVAVAELSILSEIYERLMGELLAG
jgi:succinyl-diaminopimelate desuccinylase